MNNRLNFRDCGGWMTSDGQRVRTGVLFRSGSLDHLSQRDRGVVDAAHLRTIIDLRPDHERAPRIADLPGTKRVVVPFNVDPLARRRLRPFIHQRDGQAGVIAAMTSVYHDMVELAAPGVRALFEHVSEAAYPLCINCRAGKDRTGYAIALILRVLGAADQDILRDHLATNQFLLPRVRRATRPLRLLSFGLLPTGAWEAAFTVHEQYLPAALERVDREYGGTAGYLNHCGVPAEQRARLRERLREPAAGD